ncbi:MAG TPA: nickel-dependent lactate racemase [Longilinea sp.]|nr:nickel-dependent lactate racemase [Longilinea sp.]
MSKTYPLPYGKKTQEFILPDSMAVDWIAPAPVPGEDQPLAAVEQALIHPVDGSGLQGFRGAKSASIAVNDKTRPVPLHLLLPPLVQQLEDVGVPRDRITLFFATGTHTPLTPAEMNALLPPALAGRFSIVSHDCDNQAELVSLGTTERGTPVLCSGSFLRAEVKIVTGNIEPHHFAGFSGGVKTFSIGLASRQTINRNHSLLLDPHARTGEFEQNPLRQDIEEIGRMGQIDFALNAVLNEHKEIVKAYSGSPQGVMQAGVPLARQICQTQAQGQYDLVIASVGGHPKDINLYQAQKALTHASMLTRDGGVVILVGACPEGSGSKGFESLMGGSSSPADVLQKFDRVNFQVGPHKAFQFARELVRIHVILLSKMPADIVRKLLLIPARSPADAIQLSMDILSNIARTAILPRAINTIPLITNK